MRHYGKLLFHKIAINITAFVMLLCIAAMMPAGQVCAAAAADEVVESVLVTVVTQDITSSRVVKRMSESVKTIGEHILLGRKITEVSERRESYEKLVRDVFDRVLVGYTLEEVRIEAGTTARIQISLVPWGDTVREVSIQTDYSGIAPDAVPLIQADMGGLHEDIRGALIGLPVDAVDWASAIARDLIREILRQKLPDFYFSLDVEAGRQTNVRLSMFPVGQLVKTTSVSLRSNSIPNLLLVHARPEVEKETNAMRGLPVTYVLNHMDYFKTRISRAALTDPVIRQFGLKVAPVIRPGVDTETMVTVEADTWRINAEAYLDVGRNIDNVSGMAHIGRTLGKRDEIFLEMKVHPGSMSWEFLPSWGHQFGSETWSGVHYRTNDQEFALWLQQGLGGRWSLYAERWPDLKWTEVRLRYKLHDFLSVEFVIDNEANWVRLVGHL